MAAFPFALVALACVVLLQCAGALTKRYEVDDRFPGWKGEVADVRVEQADGTVTQPSGQRRFGAEKDWGFGALKESWRGEMDMVSWAPRVASYKAFLSVAECEALLELGAASELQSSIALPGHDGSIVDAVNKRITETAFFRPDGLADLTLHLDSAQGDAALVDSITHTPTSTDYRLATMIIKLSPHSSLGGEVIFPLAPLPQDWLAPAQPSMCAQHKLAISLKQGDAILVYHRHVNNAPQPEGAVQVCSAQGGREVVWASQTLSTLAH